MLLVSKHLTTFRWWVVAPIGYLHESSSQVGIFT
jgi:hypothetical protein